MCVVQARDLLHCPFFVYSKSTSLTSFYYSKGYSSPCSVRAVNHYQMLERIIQGSLQAQKGSAWQELQGNSSSGKRKGRDSSCTGAATVAILSGTPRASCPGQGVMAPTRQIHTSVFVIKLCWEYTAQPTQPGCARLAAHVPVFCLRLPKKKHGSPAHVI